MVFLITDINKINLNKLFFLFIDVNEYFVFEFVLI